VDWLPGDTNFLTVFGAVLAVGTTLLGLVVGLGQFTGAARARRIIEWTSAALESEKDAARRIVLERLKLRGQGYLVAARYVPGRLFTEAVVWTLVAPTTVILTVSRNSGDVMALVASISAGTVTVALVARRAIRLYAERMRVARQFAIGGMDVEPVRIDMLAQMEGGTRREFILGFACSISVTGTGALLAWAIVAGRGSFTWVWAALGVFACWNCLQLVHTYAERWSHQAPKNLLGKENSEGPVPVSATAP